MIALTSFRLIWFFYHLPQDQPVAVEGILDLDGYDLDDHQTVSLDGEWAFFPEQLISDPKDISTNHIDHHLHISEGDNLQEQTTFGTYYLKIKIDEEVDFDHLFSISIPSTNTASALYVNGHLKE